MCYSAQEQNTHVNTCIICVNFTSVINPVTQYCVTQKKYRLTQVFFHNYYWDIPLECQTYIYNIYKLIKIII